jgi:hypothetical protein
LIFVPNLFQLATVQPVAAAAWTLIDFDSAFGIKTMAHEFDAGAARAVAFARRVDAAVRITRDIEKVFARSLTRFVHALKLKGIKPDAAAATVADIDRHSADLQLGQFMKARGTFHRSPRFRGISISGSRVDCHRPKWLLPSGSDVLTFIPNPILNAKPSLLWCCSIEQAQENAIDQQRRKQIHSQNWRAVHWL